MHISFLARNRDTERKEIYLTLFLRSLALSLIGIFVPAYLITLGFSFRMTLVFLMVTYIAYTIFSPVAAEVAARLGVKRTALAGLFTTAIYIFMLYGISRFNYLLAPSAIVGGLAAMLFWIPINTHFVNNTDHKHMAEESGWLHGVVQLAAIVGPVAGALILSYFGFPLLYAISGGLLLVGAVPLFLTKGYKLNIKHNWLDALNQDNMYYVYVFFIRSFFGISAAIVFPFYIYMSTLSFETTGFMAATVGLGTAIGAVFIGKLSDKIGRHKVMRAAALTNCLVWVAILFIDNIVALYALAVLLGLSIMALHIVVFAIFGNKVRSGKKVLAERIVFRDVGINLGCLFVFTVMVLFMPYAFKIAFSLAATGALYFMFIRF